MSCSLDLCWTNVEDLFSGVNLDTLFFRQAERLKSQNAHRYPYLLLVYTGNLTMGIDLGATALDQEKPAPPAAPEFMAMLEETEMYWTPHEEPFE